MHRPHLISIWFFIGVLLAIYGALIFGSGMYDLVTRTPREVVMSDLHPAIWWGALLLVLGALYAVKFRPRADAGRQ